MVALLLCRLLVGLIVLVFYFAYRRCGCVGVLFIYFVIGVGLLLLIITPCCLFGWCCLVG